MMSAIKRWSLKMWRSPSGESMPRGSCSIKFTSPVRSISRTPQTTPRAAKRSPAMSNPAICTKRWRRPPRATSLRHVDLSESLALEPPSNFEEADAWRIHFHVPVDAENLGPLGTTRRELKQALTSRRGIGFRPASGSGNLYLGSPARRRCGAISGWPNPRTHRDACLIELAMNEIPMTKHQ